jgi:DNA-directed RNA polymerase subunit L
LRCTGCRRTDGRVKKYESFKTGTAFEGNMELNLVEKTKDSVTIRIKDADMTFITPLLNKLSDDVNVSIVRYVDHHPELEEPILYVSTKKGTPGEAIKKATSAISEYYSKLNISK